MKLKCINSAFLDWLFCWKFLQLYLVRGHFLTWNIFLGSFKNAMTPCVPDLFYARFRINSRCKDTFKQVRRKCNSAVAIKTLFRSVFIGCNLRLSCEVIHISIHIDNSTGSFFIEQVQCGLWIDIISQPSTPAVKPRKEKTEHHHAKVELLTRASSPQVSMDK